MFLDAPDTEYHTHSEGKALVVPVRSILVVQHVIESGDLPVLVGDLVKYRMVSLAHWPSTATVTRQKTHDWVLDICGSELATIVVDVLHPPLVVLEAVRRDTDELHAALLKVGRPADRRRWKRD